MSIFSLLAARSVSICETPACENRFFRSCAQREILVQQLRVVAVGVPARPPGLVEPEPESVRVNLLAHVTPYAFCVARGGFLRARSARCRRALRRCLAAPPRRLLAAAPRRAPSGAPSASPRGTRGPSAPGARASSTALVGVARRHVQPIDVAAEPVLLLRVGHRRPQHLRDVARRSSCA